MAIKVLQAAKYLAEKSRWRFTHLELQKLIYMCHVIYMGEKDDILIDGNFQAWKFGPVHPELFKHLKDFGASCVTKKAFNEIDDLTDKEICETLKEASEVFKPGCGPQLVEITHWDKGAWKKNYIPGLGHIVIPDKDIKEEFKALSERV